VLDRLLADGVDAIPGFSTWSGTIGILVEAATELRGVQLVAALAERFAPVARLPVMPSLAVTCLGPGERVMGRALATMGSSRRGCRLAALGAGGEPPSR
jgi:hypothetical protein